MLTTVEAARIRCAIEDRSIGTLRKIADRLNRSGRENRLADHITEWVDEREDKAARDAYWDAKIDEARGR